MERETKVGLLAGLAVIICFSVILANRGRRDVFDAAPGPFFVDFSNRPGAVPESGTRPNLPAHAMLPARANESSVVRANAAPTHDGAPVRPGDVRTDRADDALLATGSFVGRSQAAIVGPVSIDQLPQPLAVNLSARGPDVGGATIPQGKESAGGAQSNQSSSGETTRTGRRYVVSPGDTLSKIATAHYGTGSSSAVQAIFDNNRGVLESRDALKAGMEILLPALASEPRQTTAVALVKSDLVTKSPLSPDSSGTKRSTATEKLRKPSTESAKTVMAPPSARVPQSDKPGAAPQGAPRWYEVKKGEGLQSIAREQLGDSSRWKEIHDLNREALATPEKLRVGTRIRLPNRDPEDGSRGRRRS